MVSLILAKKIASLLLILLMGVGLVRSKVLKPEDSRVLSTMALYLIMPCLTLSAFSVDYSPAVLGGLAITFVTALVAELLMIAVVSGLRKVLKLSPVEQASSIYSNAGNLIIPIVSSVLGPQYVIYTMSYGSVQQVLFWSHLRQLMTGEKKILFRKILLNPNMIAVIVGLSMFLSRLRFPPLLADAISSMGNTIGPLSMIISGMLLGGMDLKKILSYRRVWLVAAIRLLLMPMMVLLLIRISGVTGLIADGKTLLMITVLASAAPCAATVTQMSQVYGQDADYASACNVVTTLLCVLTMPLIILLMGL